MPLFRYEQTGKEIDQICEGCRFVETKPGAQPPELVRWINAALSLRSLHEMGATFAYPDALMPREWIAMRALADADAQVKAKERRAREREADQTSEQARLQARLNRR